MTEFLKNKIFEKASFVINYAIIKNIRNKCVEFENEFKSIFDKEPEYTNVPDKERPDLPRFILKSRKTESLQVSQVDMKYDIRFTDDIAKDEHNKCIDVFKKRIDFAIKSLPKVHDFIINNIGVIYSLNYSTKDLDINSSNYLFDTFFKIKTSKSIGNVNFEFSVIDKDKYYTNIKIGEYQLQDLSKVLFEKLQRDGKFATNEGFLNVEVLKAYPPLDKGVSVRIDINNKYDRLKDLDKKMSLEEIEVLNGIATDIFQKKIDNFIITGEGI